MTADRTNGGTQTEVGAEGGDLRYWLAEEGLRQGGARLAGQAANLQAMEARATSPLTWSVTVGIALVAAFVDARFRWPAFGALVLALAAAVSCVVALWPRAWHSGGRRPSELDRLGFSTELEFVEAMALGNEKAAERNETRLRSFALSLRVAWISLASAPAAAGLLAAASSVRL